MGGGGVPSLAGPAGIIQLLLCLEPNWKGQDDQITTLKPRRFHSGPRFVLPAK